YHARNMAVNNVRKIDSDTFYGLENLKYIKMANNGLTVIQSGAFQNLSNLQKIYSTRQHLCCLVPATVVFCTPFVGRDRFTTCADLLGHTVLQILVWVIGGLALVGNSIVLFIYIFKIKKRNEPVPILLITNLAVSDLLMASYTLIIGSADLRYRGSYAKNAENWLQSSPCLIATFLCCISSLMSVLMMLMISIDRYIYIAFPYSTKRISEDSAKFIIGILWLCSIAFIGLPVAFSINAEGDRRLHAYTSICMASNRTNKFFYGWLLAYTSLTLICWLITCTLYGHMLIVIRRTSTDANNNSSSDADKRIALRLFAIVLTDFISWCPYYIYIIFMISDANAYMPVTFQFAVILALPINSAINPFLYTL
ncbi:uncharacterized protein TRIADDRAFT_733, partial [Trichoplax adhaerens]